MPSGSQGPVNTLLNAVSLRSPEASFIQVIGGTDINIWRRVDEAV